MPVFAYLGRNSDGRIARGTAEANTPGELLLSLGERGIKLLKIEQTQSDLTLRKQIAMLHPLNWIPPTAGQVEIFLDQMAVLLRSGMSLLASLRTTQQQSMFEPMSQTIADLSTRIQAGSSLADAMNVHNCFPPLVVQMVRVGEKTGNLDLVFSKSAEQITQRRAQRNNVITAMAYPSFVALSAIGAAAFMVSFVIPKLKSFLSGLGRQLPAMTQRLVDISDWFQAYGAHLAFGLLISISALVAFYLTPRGRLFVDWVLSTSLFSSRFIVLEVRTDEILPILFCDGRLRRVLRNRPRSSSRRTR